MEIPGKRRIMDLEEEEDAEERVRRSRWFSVMNPKGSRRRETEEFMSSGSTRTECPSKCCLTVKQTNARTKRVLAHFLIKMEFFKVKSQTESRRQRMAAPRGGVPAATHLSSWDANDVF